MGKEYANEKMESRKEEGEREREKEDREVVLRVYLREMQSGMRKKLWRMELML